MNMRFDGADYNPKRDNPRLVPQFQRVKSLMLDEKWRTLEQISKAVDAPHASVSAQLRHLRKKRFGSYTVERKHAGDGLYFYRVKNNLVDENGQTRMAI